MPQHYLNMVTDYQATLLVPVCDINTTEIVEMSVPSITVSFLANVGVKSDDSVLTDLKKW
jgi:hypothetical protein